MSINNDAYLWNDWYDATAYAAWAQSAFATTATISDPYQGSQWYIRNTGQNGGTSGVDIDVTRVWADDRGAGVTIAVIDDGFDLTHADLVANFNTALDYDFRRNDADPSYESGDVHGTAVAGIIAADDNGTGIVGVAPDATLVGLRISFSSDATLDMFSDALDAAGSYDVINNSWGFTGAFTDDFSNPWMNGLESALENAVISGRGGLGGNIVFAGGNSGATNDNVNYHNLTNAAYVIAVAAIDNTGKVASFSTHGYALLVSAPGIGLYTTDNSGANGYVSADYVTVAGTSFAAPVVSGVIALMLEANPTLGYRDVQEILAYSSKLTDAASTTWETNGADNWNGTGLHYSPYYGFGLVDAHTAVRLAESWGTGQGTYATLDTVTGSSTQTVGIPDGSSCAVSTITLSQDITIDHVEICFDIDHALASQLDVVLVSPCGTESVLLDNVDSTTLPDGFVYSTVADWGESSLGTWTLKVYDTIAGTVGTLLDWSLNILGDAATLNGHYIFTDEFSSLSAATCTLTDTNGGIDLFNAAAMTNTVVLDLGAGSGFIGSRNIAIASGTTIENVSTGDAGDAVTGNAVDNGINTGRGDDYIFASAGHDVIDGSAGTDTYVLGNAFHHTVVQNGTGLTITDYTTGAVAELANVEHFQIGNATYTASGLLTLAQPAAPQTLTGTSAADFINGASGDDTISGGAGMDTLNGLQGNDTIHGGTDTDYIWGGFGDDTLYGDDGNDYLYGESGNDTLTGGAGIDRLYGGAGNDVLQGGAGTDYLYGGGGRDTYVFDGTDGSVDSVYDFSAKAGFADTLDLSHLLAGYDATDPIADFVRFAVSGNDTTVSVNADGKGSDFVAVACIYGAALTDTLQHYLDAGILKAEA